MPLWPQDCEAEAVQVRAMNQQVARNARAPTSVRYAEGLQCLGHYFCSSGTGPK